MTVRFEDFLEEQLKDDEFRAEYEALEPEMAIIQAMIDARYNSGLTSEELSEKTGIPRTEIKELETGQANPTLRKLQQLARGLGKKLHIEFQPV